MLIYQEKYDHVKKDTKEEKELKLNGQKEQLKSNLKFIL